MGLDPAHRTLAFSLREPLRPLVVKAFDFNSRDHKILRRPTLRTPAGFLSGTHKNYSLVDCPIYSVVKYRPHQLAPDHPA
jgi:hypothetical protein